MIRVVSACALALVLIGCTATKGTGGGWISSVVPGEKATFGFEAHCDPRGPQPPLPCDPRAAGRYEDKGAGVRMELEMLLVSEGASCQTAGVEYRSQSAARPGNGTATVTACDNDALPRGPREVRVPDTFTITVKTGPYAGYTNGGPLLGGNIRIVLAAQ